MYKISLIAMIMFLFLTAGICLSQQVRFTDNSNGTITDNVTGLIWQQTDNGTTYTWQGALDDCNGLTLAGRSDWRLPNIKELESIVDDSTHSPAIDSVFNDRSSSYWSASSSVVSPTNAWVVDFSEGDVHGSTKTNTHYVRCVRPSTIPSITTVTSSTGKVWMDRNLGASRVATSINDAEAFGDLYQWGRGTDGHEKRDSDTNTNLSDSDTPGHGDFIVAPNSPYDWRSPQNNNLWQGVSGTNNPCPSGFRLPTIEEWQAELTALAITNRASAFASPLRLVSAGHRLNYDGAIYNAGNFGFYWSSSVDDIYTSVLDFSSGDAYTGRSFRANSFSVRCLKDTFLPPTDHVAVNFTIDDTANRSYSNADGLAWKGSFNYDPVTRILTYAGAWSGPYPMMYDDGPWSSGGHEPLGSVAGDNIWGVTVWVPTTTTQSFEYGAIRGSVNGSDGLWIWIGPNETFTVTSGATVPIDAPGLVIPID